MAIIEKKGQEVSENTGKRLSGIERAVLCVLLFFWALLITVFVRGSI